jgi:hypothetical protein
MLWVNAIAIITIIAQGQFGFIVDPASQIVILGVVNIVLRAITGEDIVWSAPDD